MIRKGTKVRLKRKYAKKGRRQTARVVRRIPDINGGVLLDRCLNRFCCWNVKDLERV